MEDYFSRILNLAWQLRQHLTQFIEDVFGCIDWIPQRPEVQFSTCYRGSLPGLARYIHGQSSVLSISNTTEELSIINATEEQPEDRISVRETTFSNGLSRIYETSYASWSSYLLQSFRLGQRLAFHVRGLCSLFANEIHTKLTRFLHRFWTTLQGSSEDIGWLQRTQMSLYSVDGTSRFHELLHDVRNGMHHLPNTLVYLLIPGLFSNHSPLYFLTTKRSSSKMGLTCGRGISAHGHIRALFVDRPLVLGMRVLSLFFVRYDAEKRGRRDTVGVYGGLAFDGWPSPFSTVGAVPKVQNPATVVYHRYRKLVRCRRTPTRRDRGAKKNRVMGETVLAEPTRSWRLGCACSVARTPGSGRRRAGPGGASERL